MVLRTTLKSLFGGNNPSSTMGQSDLYIHGTDLQLKGIKTMMMKLAEQIGCTTDDESALNIPL